MSNHDVNSMPEQAKQLLKLLVEEPDLRETVEGFARWRLMQAAVRRHVDEVASALDWLVTQGYLLRHTRQGVAATFSLNPERTAQARRLVNDEE